MLKTILTAAGLMLFSAAGAKAMETPVDVRVNGEYIKTYERPFVENGTAYAPVRSIAEAAGAHTVEWNDDDKEVTIRKGGTEITIAVNTNSSARLYIVNDRVFAPVRYIGELLGGTVSWDAQYSNAEININDTEVARELISDDYDHDELFWLSRIIHAESQGEPLEGQIAVGHVILNRVRSSQYPNTVWGVIFDKKYAVQFEPVLNGTIYNDPLPQCISAAKLAFTNESSVGDCLYFFAPRLSPSNWITKNRQYYTTIGNHDFYL